MGRNYEHDHPHPKQSDEEDTPASYYQLMEIALRELLQKKSVITASELRAIHEQMDRRGPNNGARMIARAWCDPAYRSRMRQDATAAAKELGLEPTWLNLIVLENTPTLHNLVVCTLCSCYPWPLLGLPPDWYKSRAYRSDAVARPRELLAKFGTHIPDTVEVRVHDSSADMRYLVMPMRPAGTDGWSEKELATLVTRDSMIGVTTARSPSEASPAKKTQPDLRDGDAKNC
ncbi:MAG: nitrile hydratase subunit alpha [Proteobacteria bacterium]|nr:nitrile hydratase subunit alpha [Pseudomonadota bacterium]